VISFSTFRFAVGVVVGAITIISCSELFPGAPEENELLDGPVAGLTPDQHAAFIRGDIAFNDDVFHPGNGLGPIFVATSCGSCHPGDGKGHPFTTLTRFGQVDPSGNHYLQNGGPQLQNRAIPGYDIEEIPAGTTSSKFTPPANTGLGYLETVPEETLLDMADPLDSNGDGISGAVSWINVPDFVSTENHFRFNGKFIGRFGKKAATFNLLHQTVNAYIEDMGITTHYHPEELLHGKTGVIMNDPVPDPEVLQSAVDDVVFYLRTLKAPHPRNESSEDVLKGKNIFLQVGCEQCHKQKLMSGYSPIDAISFREVHPYTDLLLHDMGPGLDDGYTEGSALTSEWRTPPLWGLGLSRDSQGGTYYLLHDGRARSIMEAILLHGGEAQASRDAFNTLNEADQQELILFLESL